MFLHSYRAMSACSRIDAVVILTPEGYGDAMQRWAGSLEGPGHLEIRAGGATRLESVRRGLEALPEDAQVVVCHDAARPFASPPLFDRVIEALRDVEGVVPVVSSPDTVKRIRGGRVVETIPRHQLGVVQTPQAFLREALIDAHRRAGPAGADATDDATLLEAAGYRVAAVEGEPRNFKITTPEDLRRAECVLADAEEAGAATERTS